MPSKVSEVHPTWGPQKLRASLQRTLPKLIVPAARLIEEPWYDANDQVQRVRPDGLMLWKGETMFLSEAPGRQR